MSDISKDRRKKLIERKKKLKERSEGKSNFIFFKADETVRIRPLPVNENEEFGMEVVQFYLGAELKGVISPATFGEPCALMEKYNELSESSDPDDKDLAGKLRPRSRFVIPVIKYKDLKGKEVDDRTGVRLALLTATQYQDAVDLFLDEEQGDFTDPEDGYDLKITRTGKGKTDTEYTMIPCRPTPLPKAYKRIWDIEEILRKEIPSYEETESMLNQFLGQKEDDDEEDEKPRKKKTTVAKTGTGKKKVLRKRS